MEVGRPDPRPPRRGEVTPPYAQMIKGRPPKACGSGMPDPYMRCKLLQLPHLPLIVEIWYNM